YVYDVAFSPDGTRVASAAWDGTVRIWDATTQRQTGLLRHDERIVGSVAFSPDGNHLASVVPGRVYLWDPAGGKPGHVRQASTEPYGEARAVFNPKGSLLALAAADASPQVWDASSGEAVAAWGVRRGNSYDVAFSPDGTRLASAERDAVVRLWD